ncbi:hypothetical protein E2P81_ATG04732 [Venturia nashicola]|nr:hypothetical protein E2P81_ATG04732 [Venturia nashicola]
MIFHCVTLFVGRRYVRKKQRVLAEGLAIVSKSPAETGLVIDLVSAFLLDVQRYRVIHVGFQQSVGEETKASLCGCVIDRQAHVSIVSVSMSNMIRPDDEQKSEKQVNAVESGGFGREAMRGAVHADAKTRSWFDSESVDEGCLLACSMVARASRLVSKGRCLWLCSCSSQHHPRAASTTHEQPAPPTSSQHHPRAASTTHDQPAPPTTSQHHPRPASTTATRPTTVTGGLFLHRVEDGTEDVRDATEDVRDATEDVRDATEDLRDATDDLRDATHGTEDLTPLTILFLPKDYLY